MFSWIRRLLGKKTVRADISEYEAQQRDLILAFLRDNPDAPEATKRLGEDFSLRTFKHDTGGASSSPISSP